MNGVSAPPGSPQRSFLEHGVLVFPRVFDGEDLARLQRAAEQARAAYLDRIDREFPNHRNSNMFFQVHNPALHEETREHLLTILEGAADPRCIAPVEEVFKGPALFRCTTLFFPPRFESRDGEWHRDMQFLLETEDELREWIEGAARGDRPHPVDGVQFQVALVDNDDVEYVPFSAGRYDSPEEFRIRCADNRVHNTDPDMPNAIRVPLRAGDAIMFNPHGIHRGRYHTDVPRLTLMYTYTPRSNPRADQFVRQPWFLDDEYMRGLSAGARSFYQQFIDQYRDALTAGPPLTFPGADGA
jgi:hypothetical protein